MAIKYKGETSNLLTALSLELTGSVNLKTSEAVLKGFFQRVFKEVSIEKKIEILTNLPVIIKPFCQTGSENMDIEHSLFYQKNIERTIETIFKILSNYIPSKNLTDIHQCFLLSAIPAVDIPKKALNLAA